MERLQNWKAILASVAAILVVVLQILQLLLSRTIETTLDRKADSLEHKTEVLSDALTSHGKISENNRQLLIQLHDELHALEQHTH